MLNGRKLWITNGNEADLFIVFATVNPEAGYKGITAFLVERGAAGLHGRQEGRQARHSRQQHLRADPRRRAACRSRQVLGEVGKGYKTAIETLNEGRIGIGAQMIGLARGALDHAINYTKERKQFGKAIAEFQGVQFQLARAAVELEAARLTVYNAARLRDAGRPFLTEAAICKTAVVGGRRARRVARRQPLRRQRVRQGISGREAVSRREDRPDLRRHVEPAAPDHRQADPELKPPVFRHPFAPRAISVVEVPGRFLRMTDGRWRSLSGPTSCWYRGAARSPPRLYRQARWSRHRFRSRGYLRAEPACRGGG